MSSRLSLLSNPCNLCLPRLPRLPRSSGRWYWGRSGRSYMGSSGRWYWGNLRNLWIFPIFYFPFPVSYLRDTASFFEYGITDRVVIAKTQMINNWAVLLLKCPMSRADPNLLEVSSRHTSGGPAYERGQRKKGNPER